MRSRDGQFRGGRGFALIEVLVALAIMTTGVLIIALVFPQMLQAQREAEMLTTAAALAQMKAEEIRRDNDLDDRLIDQLRMLTEPTQPIVFPREWRLTYSYSGRSLMFEADPSDPRAAPGVARVIIRYAPEYRPTQDVLYELRFNQTNP